MAGNAKRTLLAQLRTKLADDRANNTAFSLKAIGQCSSAFLEMQRGFFTASLTRNDSSIAPFRFNLQDPAYATVGRLMQAIGELRGWDVVPDSGVNNEHPSLDLSLDGRSDATKTVTLKHCTWSDGELESILEQAISLHNPNYAAVTSVPAVEHPYVLMKAAGLAYRALASDAGRRMGGGDSAETFLKLANDADSQYDRERKVNQRNLPVSRNDEESIGAGQIIVGALTRTSLRFGVVSPMRRNNPPTPPNLYEPNSEDVEDTLIRIRSSEFRDEHLGRYELWRDVTPNVQRNSSGSLPYGGYAPGVVPGTPGTSIQVFGALLDRRVQYAAFTDGIIPDGSGQPLEPDTDYYYRLYLMDVNREVVPSNIVRAKTRSMRSRFRRLPDNRGIDLTCISVSSGPLAGGTSVTVAGYFTQGLKVKLHGKDCEITSQSSALLTFLTPAFVNPDLNRRRGDLVLYSLNGLQDVFPNAWTFYL